jgi:hypothetical protein
MGPMGKHWEEQQVWQEIEAMIGTSSLWSLFLDMRCVVTAVQTSMYRVLMAPGQAGLRQLHAVACLAYLSVPHLKGCQPSSSALEVPPMCSNSLATCLGLLAAFACMHCVGNWAGLLGTM